jgi:hypothetical protein
MKQKKVQACLPNVNRIKIFSKVKLLVVFMMVAAMVTAQSETHQKNFAKVQDNQKTKISRKDAKASLPWPPRLPDGKEVVTDRSSDFLVKPENVQLKEGVQIAKTPPTIDFLYFFGQTNPGKLWSVWGDGSTHGSKYYTSIGNHNSPRGEGQVYEYDSKTMKLRMLMDVKDFLEKPGMLAPGEDYIPGKIHSRTEMGSDGWIYFSTHRGSTQDNTTDARGYKGDNIYRVNPKTGEQQIAAHYPMPKHTIPASVLDPKRLIYYGGTAQGNDSKDKGVWFIAYDVKNNKLLKKAEGGFDRYAIFASSTGCVYWRGLAKAKEGGTDAGAGGRQYDPKTNEITPCPQAPVVRACTQETKNGIVYGFTQGDKNMWAFNTRTETLKTVGPGMVASQTYVTSMDLDPVNQRYIYYVPGAHGGGIKDGTPVVQYDLKTNTRKIIAFLSKFYTEKYGYSPDGTFSTAVSPDGSILYITWNGSRLPDAKDWDTAAMTVIHIPKSERMP